MSKLTTTCYLTLRPKVNQYTGKSQGFTVKQVTQSAPKLLSDGEIYIKANVSIPASAFEPAITATIDVPESAVQVAADVEVQKAVGMVVEE